MSIYIVKNERNEEVAAYTNPYSAESMAEELHEATQRKYRVEELADVSTPATTDLIPSFGGA